ncbi:MAG: trimethylamine methyltransferase family protein [Anaerolineales bacterium]|nr:trimethylamine methyltransferase family protein [Anaerolineales bacterium]
MSLDSLRSERRSARRAELRQVRSRLPLLTQPFRQPRNPLPPLEILNPAQVEELHLASLHILENTGVQFQDAETLSLWEQAGAQVDHKAQHVRLDRGLVLELVAKAPRSFTWRARNPARNVLIGEVKGDAGCLPAAAARPRRARGRRRLRRPPHPRAGREEPVRVVKRWLYVILPLT